MTLPLDVSRCAGRYDFDPDGEWCPERHTCKRYMAWQTWDRNTGVMNYQNLSCSMAVRDCRDKIEVRDAG